METGSEFYHEVRIFRADGQERWLAAAGQLTRDASGKPLKMIGVNYDITDRKLSEAKLREARAEAEAANRAKDRFLAVLSHELRGPLSPVAMILTDWARYADELPAGFLEDIDMIRRNVTFQTRLIDDLLDFNRIATGKLSIRPEPMNLHELLRRCLDAAPGIDGSQGVDRDVNLRATRGDIVADPARLEQVVGNVLRNAIKFTAAGTIDVETQDSLTKATGRASSAFASATAVSESTPAFLRNRFSSRSNKVAKIARPVRGPGAGTRHLPGPRRSPRRPDFRRQRRPGQGHHRHDRLPDRSFRASRLKRATRPETAQGCCVQHRRRQPKRGRNALSGPSTFRGPLRRDVVDHYFEQ